MDRNINLKTKCKMQENCPIISNN